MKMPNLKKAVVLSAAAIISLSAVFPVAAAGAEWKNIGMLGDLNNDRTITVADLIILAKHMLGHEPLTEKNSYKVDGAIIGINGADGFTAGEYIQTADIDQSGTVDIFDMVSLRNNVIFKWGPIVWKWSDEEEDISVSTTSAATTMTAASTTTTAAASVSLDSFINPPIKDVQAFLPSQGDAELVIFYVDFPDCKYNYEPSTEQIEKIAFGEMDFFDSNYPFESMSGFYTRSSKGAINLKGKAFRYTAKENQAAYDKDKDKLLKECYEAFDANTDFSRFDGNNDGYIDATLISVPTEAGNEDWWPCAGPSGLTYDPYLKFDGKSLGHLITGNAQIKKDTDYANFNNSYLHEMGHCMGLPDYYLYNVDASDIDKEGLHGKAGIELMDDALSDFCAVSKIQLGWYNKSQVQIFDGSKNSQTFILNNAQSEGGNCIFIPRDSSDDKFHGEYMVIEYNTTDGNNLYQKSRYFNNGSGIRIFHADTEVISNGYYSYFKYASGSDEYTKNNKGRRFIRIVEDTKAVEYAQNGHLQGEYDNYFHTGDVIDSSTAGFAWYDSSGAETVDTGISITVGELSNGSYAITVNKK